MQPVPALLSDLELRRTISLTGLYHNFPRRNRVVQVPRVLGSQQGWIFWQEASPVPLGFLPPSRRCCRKREFCIIPSFSNSSSIRTQSFSPVLHSLHTSPGSQGVCRTQPRQHRESLLMLDLQHIPPDSLDIYAILCCEHWCVYKSFAREMRN